MTEAVRKHRYTIDEYLRLERDSRDKHEFHDGEILAMSGGSPTHSLIASNVGRAIGNALQGKNCRVYESNLRIRVAGDERYLYADASVICGPSKVDADDVKRESVTNPLLIVEVLSSSTEAYDRGKKFERYRTIDSLQEYVLISQDQPLIEIFFRQPDGTWMFSSAAELTAIAELRSVGVSVSLADVYADVEFAT